MLNGYPNVRPFLSGNDELTGPYLKLGALLRERGFPYRWIGTKLPGRRRDLVGKVGDNPTIVCVRDVVTWSAKNKIVMEHYPDRDQNVVPTIVDYVEYFIDLYKLRNRIVIRLEDLITSRKKCLRHIAKFLDVEDDSDHFDEWWKRPAPAQEEPKTWIRWHHLHRSAFTPPQRLDTESVFSDHPFWSELLPIFYRYYDAADIDREPGELDFDTECDLETLKTLKSEYVLSLKHAFRKIRSGSIQGFEQNEGGNIEVLIGGKHGRRVL